MIPDSINTDSSGPFRRHPWLYGLVILVAIGIVSLLIYAAWSSWNQRRLSSIPPSGQVETEGERSDRLVIMNALNTFNLLEAAVSADTDPDEKVTAKKEHIEGVIAKLESLSAEDSIQGAQSDVLQAFKKWRDELDGTPDLLAVKNEFMAVGAKYPWLNTLAWIIILNRL